VKILQLVLYFPPAWSYGGPVRVVYEISKELVKRGHEVTVFTTDVLDKKNRNDIDTNKMQLMEGIRVHYFRNISNRLAHDQSIFLTPKLYSHLRQFIREFDVVHLHEYYSIQSILTSYYCKKYKIPYILHAHGSLPPERGRSLRKKVFNKLVGKPILKYASRVIAISQYEKNQYLDSGIPEDKISVIPNGLQPQDFSALPSRSDFGKKYPVGDQDKVVLYLGQLMKLKAPDILLEAFYGLNKTLEHLKLVFVGPDRGFKNVLLEQVAKLNLGDKVIFTGLLTGRDKLAAYSRADVFALPSRSEGLSTVTLEAAACGLPVVISDRCGVPEVSRYNAGEIVRCNKDELKEALKRILTDSKLAQEMGQNGRRMVAEKFSWGTIVDSLLDEYKRAIHWAAPSPQRGEGWGEGGIA